MSFLTGIFYLMIFSFLTDANTAYAQTLPGEESAKELFVFPFSGEKNPEVPIGPADFLAGELALEQTSYLESVLNQNNPMKEKEKALRSLRKIAKEKPLPDAIINLLIYIINRGDDFFQELSVRALKEATKWSPMPENIISKIEIILQDYSRSHHVRLTLMKILKEQIQKYFPSTVKVHTLVKIISDKKEHLEIRKEAVYPLVEWAKLSPLPDSVIDNIGQIVVDKKEDEQLRKTVLKIFHFGAKHFLISPERVNWFLKILLDKKENYSIRLSAEAVIREISQHHTTSLSVIKSLKHIIYDKKEHKALRRNAINSFMRIAQNPSFQTQAVFDTLKYIVYDNTNSKYIRFKATEILSIFSFYKPQKKSLLTKFAHSLKNRCQRAFR